MIQHDYLLEIIAQFVQTVMNALRQALGKGDVESVKEVEAAVGELLELDPAVALELAPESLATMMFLSGMGNSLAEYVTYALRKTSEAYERLGQGETAQLRRAQGEAVARSFGCDYEVVPHEFEDFEAQGA